MFEEQKTPGVIARTKGFLQKLRTDTTGNTLFMMAMAMIPLAGMIGGGLDMSRAYMARAKLQNACDAASLAARQGMSGTSFTSADIATANKYFNFNFPAGTMSAENVQFNIAKDSQDEAALTGSASAEVPTSLMAIFSKDTIEISVNCNVKRDLGNNDVMLVLDVTGSMQCDPGYFPSHVDCDGDSNSKIARLRTGAMGLYRALQDGSNARTRFGLMPYSGTVNVGRYLRTRDILRTTTYPCDGGTECSSGFASIDIKDTNWAEVARTAPDLDDNSPYTVAEWNALNDNQKRNKSIKAWRLDETASCIEERPTAGNTGSAIQISSDVSQADIDAKAANRNDTARQWGIYATPARDTSGNSMYSPSYTQTACPSPARKLQQYGTESAFQTAIDDATFNVTGGTYHDVGIIWGARWLSPTGIFANNNPSEFNGFPVNKHIVFMTDGIIDTGGTFYSTYSVNSDDDRMSSDGSHTEQVRARFLSACSRAKAMDMTIWVIALDVGDADDPDDPATADIRPCATSVDHFYTSDGTDLEAVFTKIGQGIGDLRLTS